MVKLFPTMVKPLALPNRILIKIIYYLFNIMLHINK